MVQKKSKRETVEISHKNPKVKIIINENHRSTGQTKNLSRKRHLSGFHNNSSGLKKELVWTIKKQNHFAKNCRKQRLRPVINRLKRTKTPQDIKELKETKGYTVKHFAFYYNNRCPVYKETKYGTSYWPQKPSPDQFKDIKKEEQDYFNELD